MPRLLLAYIAISLLLGVAAPVEVRAQEGVPDHQPGTVCLTPVGWCWAAVPGPPGAPCECLTSSGYIPGVLG